MTITSWLIAHPSWDPWVAGGRFAECTFSCTVTRRFSSLCELGSARLNMSRWRFTALLKVNDLCSSWHWRVLLRLLFLFKKMCSLPREYYFTWDFLKKKKINALLRPSNLVGSVLTYFVKCWCNRFGFLKSFTATDSEQELNGPAMGQRNKL